MKPTKKRARSARRTSQLMQTVRPRFDDFELHENAIGYGTESAVYLARHSPNRVFVAMKAIDLESDDPTGEERIARLAEQVRLCRLLSHPSLLPVLGSLVEEQTLWIITPLMSAGSVLLLLDNYFKSGLEEALVASVIRPVVQGLAYIHEQGFICHCVRAEHILVDTNGQVCLSGFTALEPTVDGGVRKPQRFSFRGEYEWMAPEMLAQDFGYTTRADIYSLGITLYEIANGMTPYPEWPPLQILLNKLDCAYPPLHNCRRGLSRYFYELVSSCLNRDPSKRPTASKILKHRFFRHARGSRYIATHLVERSIQLREADRVQQERQAQLHQHQQQADNDAMAVDEQEGEVLDAEAVEPDPLADLVFD